MKLYNSTHNFYRGDACAAFDQYNQNNELASLTLVKNETFGFFVSFHADRRCCLNLMDSFDLPWWGLEDRYRLTVESDVDGIRPHLLGYVTDDDGIEKADILLRATAGNYPPGEVPVFIEGTVPADGDADSFSIHIHLYRADGYEKEERIESVTLTVNVLDLVLEDEPADGFFMDLWQHPSSWARAHGVEYFSEEHFAIIRNYLEELKELHQKVIHLNVSDFPWAGQMCFAVTDNPSRLYEYNIVDVRRLGGGLVFDFTRMDRYIDTCLEVGIREEINLFGMIGNWHGYDFGSPVTEYDDPIRVKVFDVDEKKYDFIRDTAELKAYFGAVFDHLHQRDLLRITKVIGDEPGNAETLESFTKFIQSCTPHAIRFKYALHQPIFLDNYTGDLDSFSVNTLLMGKYFQNGKPEGDIAASFPKMTWYACCFPSTFNSFIKNPLIESRYFGAYTYLWKMKGMLRWAYGIFVEDVFEDIRYKPEKWAAGDMMLVYPGPGGKPLKSLRERNILYGIQDFHILKMLERRDAGLYEKWRNALNIRIGIAEADGDIVLDEYTDYDAYLAARNCFVRAWMQKEPSLRVVWTRDLNSAEYQDALALRREVFLDELQGSEDVEISEEEACDFAVLYDGDRCVATGRIFRPEERTAHLQRIAVKKNRRGQGLGRILLEHMEQKCVREGFTTIAICASQNAVAFYKRLGYKEQGEWLLRDRVPHIWMAKAL